MKKVSILVVGSINMDVIARDLLFDDIASQTDVYSTFEWKIGGKGLNLSCSVARLGGRVALVGRVGKDSFGAKIIDCLKNNAVEERYVFEDPEKPTGLSVLRLMERGEYRLTNVMGATSNVSVEDVRKAIDSFCPDFVMMPFELPEETVFGTVDICRERHISVIVDAGPPRPWDITRLNGIFMLSPNATETYALTGILPEDEITARKASEVLRQKTNARYILLKMGGRGAYIYCDEAKKLIPTFSGVTPIDSTGCGDAFTGSVALRLGMGYPIEKAIVYSHAVASIVCTRYGGFDAVPSVEETERFLNENCSDEAMWK